MLCRLYPVGDERKADCVFGRLGWLEMSRVNTAVCKNSGYEGRRTGRVVLPRVRPLIYHTHTQPSSLCNVCVCVLPGIND